VCCFFCQSFPATSKLQSLIEMLFFSSRCFTHHKTINGIWPDSYRWFSSWGRACSSVHAHASTTLSSSIRSK
jgi:hypothetical protein